MTPRIFLLSPANCGGSRARLLLSPTTTAVLAPRLHSPAGAPIGDVFAFVSGLYFRGKLTYARRFAAREFRHIGIFFLRHHRGAGAESIWQGDEAVALAHPQHQFFRESR